MTDEPRPPGYDSRTGEHKTSSCLQCRWCVCCCLCHLRRIIETRGETITIDRDALFRAYKELTEFRTQRTARSAAFNEQVELLKACEQIAEGDDGWRKLANLCPSTAAVAKLRRAFELSSL